MNLIPLLFFLTLTRATGQPPAKKRRVDLDESEYYHYLGKVHEELLHIATEYECSGCEAPAWMKRMRFFSKHKCAPQSLNSHMMKRYNSSEGLVEPKKSKRIWFIKFCGFNRQILEKRDCKHCASLCDRYWWRPLALESRRPFRVCLICKVPETWLFWNHSHEIFFLIFHEICN